MDDILARAWSPLAPSSDRRAGKLRARVPATSNPWFVVCAGSFASRASARKVGGRKMKKHRPAKVLSILVITAFLVCAGAVSCCPWAGPLPGPTPGGPPPEPPPGGQVPGQEVPGGPGPGGELRLVLVADPDMVPQGGCAMLHWEVAPPGECRVLLNGQEVPPMGEQQVCPPGTMTYELLVETPSGPQVRTLTVNVGGGPGGGPGPTPQGPGPAPTGAAGGGCAGAPTFSYFTASASSISAGQQVQLSWGPVTNGTSGPLVGSVVLSPGGFGQVGSPGSRWASPTTTTTYRLTATGCGGTATKDVTVTVGGAAAAATATPHPGGPTATTQAAGPTATKQAPTATNPGVILTVIPFVPAATATTGSTMSTLQVTNDCGRFIDSIFIKKQGASDWGSDRLSQNDYLGHGETRTFQLAQGFYEVRAECCDQRVVSETTVNLLYPTYDWDIIAALDIHNDTGHNICEIYIVPSTQAGWGNNWLTEPWDWPGCFPSTGSVLYKTDRMRCYFSPGSYDLRAIACEGQVYTEQQANLQGNSGWFVATEFWTPPADY